MPSAPAKTRAPYFFLKNPLSRISLFVEITWVVSFLDLFRDSRFASSDRLHFLDLKSEDIPRAIKQRLPKNTRSAKKLSGLFEDHVFSGTLDEVMPSLLEESLKHNRVTFFISKDEKWWSIVVPQKGKNCKKPQKVFKIYKQQATTQTMTVEERCLSL